MKIKVFSFHNNKYYKFIINIFFLLFLFFYNVKYYPKDEITLVTALFKMKSKFSFDKYLKWVENLLLINCSIVFFVDKEISNIIKSKRPFIYENKTIWIETSIKDFYTYKNFRINFIESYEKDLEKSYHTINLYLIWAEKCHFLKKVIYHNYFHSQCFYWIDAGYFRDKSKKYINGWPCIKKCKEDPRVLINSIRKLSNNEIKELKNFNISFYENFIKKTNVGGGFFGGNHKYLKKFIYLYYKAIKDFNKHNMFIGKDQNIFAYVAYLNPKIVNIVQSGNWHFFKDYLSKFYK